MSAGVTLDDGVGDVNWLSEVVTDVGRDEPVQDNLHEEDGTDQSQEVGVERLVGLGRQTTEDQREQESVGTEGPRQGKSDGVNGVLGLDTLHDGNGVEEEKGLSYVRILMFEAQDLNDRIAVQGRHFDRC